LAKEATSEKACTGLVTLACVIQAISFYGSIR
jgi:hypothetical protein